MTASPTVDQLADHVALLERRRRMYGGLFAVIFVILFMGSFVIAEDMNSGSFLNGLSQFFDYPSAVIQESFEAGSAWFQMLWQNVPSLIDTINMAAVATLFGTCFAMILAFVASSNLQVFPPLIPVARRFMDITRAFPELIVALFLIFVLGTSPVPAIIAIAFHTSGALGKLFSEVNENIDRGPLEGLAASGATWFQRMRFGVLPQVLPNYISYALLRFEINIRASAILGFVGAGGIGQELRKAISWSQGAETSALFVLLFLTIVTIDQISAHLRHRLVGKSFLQTAS
jgi:phosphonate transport system permease protein